MTPLASIAELDEGSVVRRRVGQTDLLVGMADGRYFAIENLCPHAYASFGTPELDGCELTCPWHGMVFDVHTGACTTWPELERVRRFPVLVENGRVFLVD